MHEKGCTHPGSLGVCPKFDYPQALGLGDFADPELS